MGDTRCRSGLVKNGDVDLAPCHADRGRPPAHDGAFAHHGHQLSPELCGDQEATGSAHAFHHRGFAPGRLGVMARGLIFLEHLQAVVLYLPVSLLGGMDCLQELAPVGELGKVLALFDFFIGGLIFHVGKHVADVGLDLLKLQGFRLEFLSIGQNLLHFRFLFGRSFRVGHDDAGVFEKFLRLPHQVFVVIHFSPHRYMSNSAVSSSISRA